jgi:hypothetical protein
MDARFISRIAVYFIALFGACLVNGAQYGTRYETENFVIQDAPTPVLAERFGKVAEQYRHDLAILWLGEPMPNWSEKCPIKVQVGEKLGAGGATSFVFDNGEVYDWDMNIQGSAERIIDSVLPHEITHTILVSHFRRPIPRWLDEGIATSVEHHTEKANYRRMLHEFLRKDVQKCLPFRQLVSLKEYPSDPMPFYAQGFSIVEYLLALGRLHDSQEHRRLVRFVQSVLETNDWQSSLQKHYGIGSLGDLQLSWLRWVDAGEQNLQIASRTVEIEALPTDSDPITLVSARPSKSIYDRGVTPIPVQYNDEAPVPISTSFGQGIILR